MENQSLAYSARELLTRLQGPSLMQIMESPAELRLLVASLDGISGIADYLAETEHRLYPEQSPKSRNLRHNRVRVVVKQPPLLPREAHEHWVLAFVEKWERKHKQGPTLREIRNYNRSKWQGDTEIVIDDLVRKEKLCKIASERTAYYAISAQTEEGAE